jgi:molybdopterin synthase catalytic subunit
MALCARMRIRVLYMGGSRTDAGLREEAVDLHGPTSLADLVAIVADRHPALGPLLPRCRWAQNLEFAEMDAALADGDEVALLPPVCGGVARSLLTEKPLAVAVDPPRDCGATVVFVGSVRDHNRGKAVSSIRYEAYGAMAAQQLERIADACAVHIEHRIGTLQVGEVSVVITASTPHREEAFARCREALERVKHDTPIWKCEQTDDGECWVGWGGG